MKTSKSISLKNSGHIQKIQSILLSAACLFLLIMPGCRKGDLAPVTRQTVKNEMRKADILPRTLEMIKINHDANFTATADYSVAVNSDGLVTYEGRSHVLVRGKVQFDISAEMLKKLDAIFAPPSIIENEGDVEERNTLPEIPEHPIITTTYSNGREPAKIWIDHNTGYPADVVYRRKKIESLLGISKYLQTNIMIAADIKEAEL